MEKWSEIISYICAMQKKKSVKSREVRARRFARWFWGIILTPFAVLVILVTLTALGAFGKLPSFEELENPRSSLATEVYAADGRMLGTFFIENRSHVDYEDLSPYLVEALVATEDARYYSHSGIDFISLARVAVKTLALGLSEQGGGSTITQQLAKNLFPREDNSGRGTVGRMTKILITKLKEWITAVKLEYNYTKEEIMAMYFNKVFYGSNAYGIKAAARTFFGKEPSEVTIPEAALLVGVVNAPTRYNPVSNPERSLTRRNTVMSRMRAAGYLTRAEFDSLSQTPIELNYSPVTHNDGIATYFREMIRTVMNMPRPQRSQFNRRWDYEQELRRWESNPIYGWCHKNRKEDGTPYNIYRDGLKIYTTLDYAMQQHAEAAVHKQLASTLQPAMDAQDRRTKTTFVNTSASFGEQLIGNAMRTTDRYRNLKEDGASNAEIDKDFRTPVRMRIFTYKGDRDTLMTPRDSILHYKRIMRASFMASDPVTGHVKAYVGGPNFRYFKYDMVKQGKRQVGSTIKPFVYTFAIDYMGFTPCTMVPNLLVTLETNTGQPWSPKEANPVEYDGVLHPLRWGLAHSRNNYSAWIMKQAGQPQAVASFINKMGIHSYIDPVNTLALGPADVSLFEMVGAYSTFANRGVFMEPIFVTRIEDRQGNLIASFAPASSEAISEETAYTMLRMLEDVVDEGTAGRLRWFYGFRDIDMGGKTGTSQESRDAWFMGVTPKLVAGAWVGGEDQSVHLTVNAEGSSLALPIFGDFMQRVYDDPSIDVNRNDKFYRLIGAVDYDCPDSEFVRQPAGTTPDHDEFFD